LLLLYVKVQQQVSVGGDVGQLSDTYLGTKQGSPLLFGLFMDVLHELILLEVLGAGPVFVVRNLQALLDIIYADNVALIAYHSHVLACIIFAYDGWAGNGCIEVLLRDFSRCPVMHQWVVLAARWLAWP
jgi:hypothetical protein